MANHATLNRVINYRKLLPLGIVLAVIAIGAYGYISIEHYGLQNFISLISIYGVAGIVFAESGLLIGFFLPGDSLLFTVGFLIHQQIIQFNIHQAVLILFVAAALGDSVGYAFGRRVGHRLFRRKDSVLFHRENLQRAEAFYERHGGKTIIIARFMPVIRTFAPIVAGISHMDYRKFLLFNLIGALLWAVGITYLGYYAGSWIESYGINVEYVIIGIILISIVPPFAHVLKEKKNRQAIYRGVTQQLRAFFGDLKK